MNAKEKKLASCLLKEAANEFGNHGCNDVDEKLYDGWTKEERQQFCKEFEEWNGSPDDYNPNFLYLPDFALMDFLAYKIENS
jgi:hypothetical protein